MRRVSFVYRHSQPPALTSTNGFAGPNARTGQSRDHEGQALLRSQASARQSLTARRSRAVDRSRERHGWSIGVRVRPHRAPHGASLPVGRSVSESGRPETGGYPLKLGRLTLALLLAIPRSPRPACEQARDIVENLLLPGINLVRMHPVPLRQLRTVASSRSASSATFALNAASNFWRDFVISRSIGCDRAGHFTP